MRIRSFASLRGPGWVALAGVLSCIASAAAQADPAGLAAADELVRGVYYEGLPQEAARNLDLLQVGYLAEVLEDPDRQRDHANVLLALALAGHPGSFEVVAAYLGGLSGELSRDGWRALRAGVTAMGHLAAGDARAEAWLTLRAAGAVAVPAVSFRVYRDERVRTQLRQAAQRALALAQTGTARATLAERAGEDPAAAEALAEFDRIRAAAAPLPRSIR